MKHLLMAMSLLLLANSAQAQSPDPKPILEWQKRQTEDERLTVFGDDLLGDSIDPNLGSLVFEHTDVSIPGNSDLPVAIVRRRSQGSLYDEGVDVDFADWELVVPKISVVTTTALKWAGQRCSGSWDSTLPQLTFGGHQYHRSQYSNGVSMDIPGQGSQSLLKPGVNSIYPGYASTVNEWYFTCTTASDGKQGFIGHAPNGDQYKFTRAILRPYKDMGFANTDQKVPRTKVILAASQVTDVNGNWVNYTYDTSGRLKRIEANDGRLITLTHSGSLITSVVANGRTWTYGYRDSNYFKPDWDVNHPGRYDAKVLASVTQPDAQAWTFTLDGMQAEPSPASRSCDRTNYTLTVKHPYGVTGTFAIKDIQHRQAYKYFTTVVDDCFDYDVEPEPPAGGWGNLQEPIELLSSRTFSVVSKTLSGTNMPDAVWTFEYEKDDVCQGVPSHLCDSYTSGGGTTPPPPPPPPGPPIDECNGTQLCRAGGRSKQAAAQGALQLQNYDAILTTLFPQKADGTKTKSVENLRNNLGSLVQDPPSQDFYNSSNPPYDTGTVFTAYGEDPLDYTNWTRVTQPSGAVITYYHLWNYLPVAGGKLIKQVMTENSVTLNEIDTDFVQHGCNGVRSLITGNPASPGHCPTHPSKTVEKRDGDTFTNTYAYNMDPAASDYSFGHAVESGVSTSVYVTPRVTYTAYQHKNTPWIKGLAQTVHVNTRLTSGYSYDSYGRKIGETAYGYPHATFGYNTDGTVKWVSDANNKRTYFYSWKRGTAQDVKRADDSHVYQYVDNNGWLIESRDGNGNITEYERDSMGRMIEYKRPTQSHTYVTYSFGAAPTQTFRRGYRWEKITYDSLFRPKEIRVYSSDNTTSDQIYTTFDYDAAGRTIFESFPSSTPDPTAGKTTEYDGLNRVRREITAAGITKHDYFSSHRHRVVDPTNLTTNYYSFGLDGPNSKTYRAIYEYKDGAYLRRTYMSINTFGELTNVKQYGDLGGDYAEEYQYYYYNARRQICRYRTKEGGDTLFKYDSAGWLTSYQQGVVNGSSCVSPSGSDKITLHRDDLNRVDHVDFADPNEHDILTTYDGNGNALTINREGTDWKYTYNALDQLLSERIDVDGRSYWLSSAYDWQGRLHRRTFPSGRQIYYTYDGLNRQLTAKNGGNNLAIGMSYHPDGQLKGLTYGNGHVYSKTITALMQPHRIRSAKGSNVALDQTYTYDARGLIKTMSDAMSPSNNRTYTYDGLGQLSQVNFGSGVVHSYKYDSIGNILEKKLASRTIAMAFSSKNRLASYTDTHGPNKSLAYDQFGNVASLGNQNFLYDGLNQPISAAGPDATGTYTYDGNRKRAKALINGKAVYNVFDKSGKLVHTDIQKPDGTFEKTDYVRAGGMDIVRLTDIGTRYVHSDLLGSPRALTASTGDVWETAIYAPYGMKISGNVPEDKPGFAGHIKDSATGLSYMQARYYDPVSSRFLSIDPVGFVQSGFKPGQFNRYAYTWNNPVNANDPDGQLPNFVIGGLIGGIVEAGIQLATHGEITDTNAIIGAALVGAVTGGIGGRLTRMATPGRMMPAQISSARATATTAVAGGTANTASTVTQNAIAGDTTSAGEAAAAFVGGSVGAGAGARFANQPIAAFEKMADAGGVLDVVIRATASTGSEIIEHQSTAFSAFGAVAGDIVSETAGNATQRLLDPK